MRIAVVGTGYQGLVVGTCLAENGHQVVCVDTNAERIAGLSQARLPIHEPGLEELVARNLEEERLHFTTDADRAIEDCLMIFLCVGTPIRDDGTPDIAVVTEAVRQIAATMNGYRIIVNKCTCPPGTAEALEKLAAGTTQHPFDIVVNPDFMKEGSAVDDFMRPDRIVIGCSDVRVREIMKELYSPFLRTGKPLLTMSPRSAEMTKLATNVMLAARISMMNQFADLCEACGADIGEVREGLSADYRIGPAFLFPGLGFGGSGLPRDLAATIRLAQLHHVPYDLFEAVQNINLRRRKNFLERIRGFYEDGLAGKRIAMWGVSFKSRTDDVRGSVGLALIDGLLESGARLAVYDPAALARLRKLYGDRIEYMQKYYAALENADGLVITTEWNEFRRPDYDRMSQLMRRKVIFDGRNLYTPKVMKELGFTYFSIGRAPAMS